ncbi:TadE/TadG family type IV pilus assembly protein [Paragemmobacter straminiformis]|uniref:TadE-like protein n=1 Tax=Paragemmobacter straminiformis TaxID=2045119 RepID=A0A842I4W8_9RHOB|nr:hypothetical protein [Gemmobacter straminiformis]MBC2833998.1 hypothetical protein [Gemmobacter straminiformis]
MSSRVFSLKSRLRGFLRDDKGSFTIEALFWLPIFVVVLSMCADTALIYAKQSQVLRVVQDANRQFAVGKFADGPATVAYILGVVRATSPNATATSVLDNGIITTTVTMPARDLVATGVIPMMRTMNVRVVLQQMKEI